MGRWDLNLVDFRIEEKVTVIICDDQSWIVNPFLWIEGETEVRRKEKWVSVMQ